MPEFAAPDVVVPGPDPAAPDLAPPDPALAPPGPGLGAAGSAMLAGALLPDAPVLPGPTVDSDADGAADTALADVGDDLVLATDLDHDGHADAVTRIGPDAAVTVLAGEPAGDPPPPPAPSVDPVTGRWTRG